MTETPFQQPGGPLRQSLLQLHDQCPLSAKFQADGSGATHPEAVLGTVMHLIASEIFRTLHRVGERQIPTEEAQVIAFEVMGRQDCPHLNTRQMETAKILTLMLARYEWTSERFMAIEERLFVDVVCPDGKTRTFTGQPDLITADPPDGLIILDLKFGRTRPPAPRDDDWNRDQGKPYLSERGHYQLDGYSLLALNAYPQAQRATLREAHIRIDELREAFITRDEIEHVQRRVGVHLQRLEEVLAGEREPDARPGTHCYYCARPHLCPVPYDDRAEGSIQDPAEALIKANRWAAVTAVRERDGKALKGWLEKHGEGIETSSGYVGWRTYPDSGKRSFGVWPGQPINGKMAE